MKGRMAATTLVFGLLVGRVTYGASLSPAIEKAKQSAERAGYAFFPTRDEILAGAKREGKLRVLNTLDPETSKRLIKAFRENYPFIAVEVQEVTGTDGAQRFLLEMQAGQVRDWDIFHLPRDFFSRFAPHAKKIDIYGMAQHGILAIPVKMIDPKNRNIMAVASAIQAVAYNKNLIAPEKVPNTWEDFLKPEFKGRKFMMDIRPHGFGSMAAGLGIEWVQSYARKLKEQEPIWVRGYSRTLTAIAAGEYALHQQANFHSCMQVAEKDPTKSLVCKVIEPIPVRLSEEEGILQNAPRPNAALLWLEFQASAAGQKIIDQYEPLKSSIYVAGSELEKITRGKRLLVGDWSAYEHIDRWVEMTVEAFGFPQAESLKKR
ncbi:MAG TPA: extracellular solute-binding protein [Candidatus Acidoferrales bacterium]|nr:extracellular solute-binding protein [Candidatus Acidoferrales bacterium]